MLSIPHFCGSNFMLVVIAYDVNTEDINGAKRLRKVAKECLNYGQRVQASVFECYLDAAQLRTLQARLRSIIDFEKDKISFYSLGNNYQNRVYRMGKDESIDLSKDVLLI